MPIRLDQAFRRFAPHRCRAAGGIRYLPLIFRLLRFGARQLVLPMP
jgi:hypothetical protein